MKCVRLVGQGCPTRVPDAEAAAIVREFDGEYCPKSFYRAWTGRTTRPAEKAGATGISGPERTTHA